MPREKTAQFSRAPPLNRLKSAARPLPVRWLREVRNHSCNTAWLTPGDLIGFDCQTVLQFTIAKDFDPGEMTTHQVRFSQQLLVHDRSGLECIEVIKIHDRIVSVKSRIVKSALRQSSN